MDGLALLVLWLVACRLRRRLQPPGRPSVHLEGISVSSGGYATVLRFRGEHLQSSPLPRFPVSSQGPLDKLGG